MLRIDSPRRARASRCLFSAVFTGLCLAAIASPAQAQLKAKDLIGYAVDKVEPKHEDIDRAIQRFAGGDVPGATELLKQASRVDPMLPPAEITLAKLYLLSKQAAAARNVLEQVRQDYPQDPEPLLIFGEQAVVGGRITDSELLFREAEQMIPSYTANPKRQKNFQMRLHAGQATVAEQRENWDASINMFYLAGGAAVAMGLYSFALPHTPPPAAGEAFSARGG